MTVGRRRREERQVRRKEERRREKNRNQNGREVTCGLLEEVAIYFYQDVDGIRNGVRAMLKEKYVSSVLDVKKVFDKAMCLTREVEGIQMNAISAYVPHVGCELEEKEESWTEVEVMI